MKKILLFSAEWCGPCKTYKPALLEFCNEKGINVEVVDVDIDSTRTAQYVIRTIPTTIILDENNNLVDRFVGSQPISVISSKL